jgi:hypothetical protein
MGPWRVDFLEVFRNVDLYESFQLMATPTVPVNISAATFFLMVRPKIGDPTPVLNLNLTSGLRFVTDGTDGVIAVAVDHRILEAIPAANYKYDLVMIRPGDASEIVFYGDFKIVNGVTDI